jgi:hypothetical protein
MEIPVLSAFFLEREKGQNFMMMKVDNVVMWRLVRLGRALFFFFKESGLED